MSEAPCAADVITALALPNACRVTHRITKKLLLENAAGTPFDKRLLQSEVSEIQWLAALKPSTIGVPSFSDEVREYLEIAVVSVKINSTAAADKVATLMHRAIPYPLVLVVASTDGVALSFAHKRWAQNEQGKVVLDGEMTSYPVHAEPACALLALAKQPQTNLYALYQGWMDALTLWQAGQLTGRIPQPVSCTPAQAAKVRESILQIKELEAQIATLRKAARKERQIARQVAGNLKIQGLSSQIQKQLININYFDVH
jgi:Domain of unknown function (DUF4391)